MGPDVGAAPRAQRHVMGQRPVGEDAVGDVVERQDVAVGIGR